MIAGRVVGDKTEGAMIPDTIFSTYNIFKRKVCYRRLTESHLSFY